MAITVVPIHVITDASSQLKFFCIALDGLGLFYVNIQILITLKVLIFILNSTVHFTNEDKLYSVHNPKGCRKSQPSVFPSARPDEYLRRTMMVKNMLCLTSPRFLTSNSFCFVIVNDFTKVYAVDIF